MDEWRSAQINVGRLVAPAEDPAVAESIGLLASVNALAKIGLPLGKQPDPWCVGRT
jgi:hypothetical protein